MKLICIVLLFPLAFAKELPDSRAGETEFTHSVGFYISVMFNPFIVFMSAFVTFKQFIKSVIIFAWQY